MSIRNKLLTLALLALLGSSARSDGIVGASGTTATAVVTACSATTGQILYDNSGSCAGTTAITTDGTNLTFTGTANLTAGGTTYQISGGTFAVSGGAWQLGSTGIGIFRHISGTTSAPTASACAGFAAATGSTDVAGRITFTSATSCAISFAVAYTNAPFCTVSPSSAASTTLVTTTTGVLTATFGTAQTAMIYTCLGS